MDWTCDLFDSNEWDEYLTDPVWAKKMGLEKRLTDPGIALADLPEIDLVVISHGHYDHLDFPTLKKLKGDPHYFVPAGIKSLFNQKGYHKVTELNWWESAELGSHSPLRPCPALDTKDAYQT